MVLQGNTLSWAPTYDQQGSFPVSILVQDGLGLSAQQDFHLTVLPPLGEAPVFSALPETLEVGQTFSLDPLATDADGDPLVLTIITAPSGLGIAENRLSWTPQENQVGSFPLILRVSDGCFNIELQTTLTVDAPDPNRPPVILSSPVAIAHQGQAYTYQAVAHDPDQDPLEWNLEQGPAAMQIDPQTGVVRWTPSLSVATKTADPILEADLLILSTTIKEDGPELKAALDLGYSYAIVTPETWRTMTTKDFRHFRAIILGDPDSNDLNLISAAEETVAIWGPAITGNVILFGGDPSGHSRPAFTFVRNAIRFAAADSGHPGALVLLSEYYDLAEPFTPVPVLDAFEPGAFLLGGAHCHNDIVLTASHPVLNELNDELLSDWNCSAHSAFQTWGKEFRVLAMGRDLGVTYTAPSGEKGTLRSVGVPQNEGIEDKVTIGEHNKIKRLNAIEHYENIQRTQNSQERPWPKVETISPL